MRKTGRWRAVSCPTLLTSEMARLQRLLLPDCERDLAHLAATVALVRRTAPVAMRTAHESLPRSPADSRPRHAESDTRSPGFDAVGLLLAFPDVPLRRVFAGQRKLPLVARPAIPSAVAAESLRAPRHQVSADQGRAPLRAQCLVIQSVAHPPETVFRAVGAFARRCL